MLYFTLPLSESTKQTPGSVIVRSKFIHTGFSGKQILGETDRVQDVFLKVPWNPAAMEDSGRKRNYVGGEVD